LPGRGPSSPPTSTEGRQRYLQRYLRAFPPGSLAGLRVVFYEHSAVGREVVPEILESLGAEVIRVGRSEEFVAIDTEAISNELLAQLQTLADQARSRFGPFDALVSTDGDSDRPMLLGVTGRGELRFVTGDVLGTLVAASLKVDAVAVPVSASDLIETYLVPRGVKVVRTRIGSPWVIAAMHALDGERKVGWEANGGFLTGSPLPLPGGLLAPLPTRDAVLPLVVALYTSAHAGRSLVDLLTDLPQRSSRSGLLDQVDSGQSRALLARFAPGDGAETVRFTGQAIRWHREQGKEEEASQEQRNRWITLRGELSSHFSPAHGFGELEEINVLDGLRLRFSNGDVAHVRPSGNAPQLRIYAVAGNDARAEAIVALALAEPDGLLRRLLAMVNAGPQP
ncbi:MAG: hypothetical protein RMJ98_18445, partial [Myxococcales bacterium]|nr:hypothetical protein [Polyangiaceae bacterium]MDW8251279.1 hypothetical protein [Myxococcales bacterium]